MAFKHPESGKHQALAEINVIPLVDIILVLLIIFMITAPLMQQAIEIDLPDANANAPSGDNQSFFLTLTQDGLIYLPGKQGEPYTMTTIKEKLEAIYATRKDHSLYLRADQDTPYGLVIDLMSLCQEIGIEKVGMVTIPKTSTPSPAEK